MPQVNAPESGCISDCKVLETCGQPKWEAEKLYIMGIFEVTMLKRQCLSVLHKADAKSCRDTECVVLHFIL